MVDFEDEYDRDDELEQALRKALRPLPAPLGFAERVLARSQDETPQEPVPLHRHRGFSPVLRWAIAAVLLLAIGLGGLDFHQRQQRRIAGERARDQVLLALRITGITIHAVREQVAKDNHNNARQQETP